MTTETRSSPRRVSKILTLEGSPLAKITARARHHEAVERLLRQKLGSPLCNHVALGALEPSRVVLVTDSPVWSNRIRYQAKSVLASLSQYFTSRQRLQLVVRIVPKNDMRPRRKRGLRGVSPTVANHLREYAKSTAADSPQARALLRIAQYRQESEDEGQ